MFQRAAGSWPHTPFEGTGRAIMVPGFFVFELQQEVVVWAGYLLTVVTVLLSYVLTLR